MAKIKKKNKRKGPKSNRRPQGVPLGSKPQAFVPGRRPLIDRRREDKEIILVDTEMMAQAWMHTIANDDFLMSSRETTDFENVQMVLVVPPSSTQVEVDFPWQQFVGRLGATVQATLPEHNNLTITVQMPSFESLYAAVQRLDDSTRKEGGEALALVKRQSDGDPATAQARAIDCAAGIKDVEVEGRFAFMRLLRHALAELSLLDYLAGLAVAQDEPTAREGRTRREREAAQASVESFRRVQDACRNVLDNPFWAHLFGLVYASLKLRPTRPVGAFLPNTRHLRGIEDYQPPQGEADAAVEDNQDDNNQEGENEAGGEDQQADGNDGARDVPMILGMRQLAQDDERRQSNRYQDYVKYMGAIDIFEPEGPFFERNAGYFAVPIEFPTPTQPDEDNLFIVVDSNTPNCAAYLLRADSPDNPADKTAWVTVATMSRKEVRGQMAFFIDRFNHTAGKFDETGQPTYIRNIKRVLLRLWREKFGHRNE